MSHSVFQTAQIMPLAPTPKTLSSKPSRPTNTPFRYPVSPPALCRGRKYPLTIRASSSAVVDDDAVASLERCFQESPPAADAPLSTSSSSANVGPVMKGGKYGAFGATTLEKSKLDLTQKQSKTSPEVFVIHQFCQFLHQIISSQKQNNNENAKRLSNSVY